MGIISSEPAEEEEISKLFVGFAERMRKQAVGSEGEPSPISNGKRPKWSSPNEEAQKDRVIISVDSLNRASHDQPILEGAPSWGGRSSNVDEIGEGVTSR